MSTKIKWGVIGSAGIARRRTIPEGIMRADNATLTAVYNPTQSKNEEVAAQFNAKACKSINELLRSDVDAIYIASPPDVHLKQVIACANAGKHILCEKPLGMNVKQVEKMIAVCKEANVKLGTALMMRFHSQHQAALQLIKDGKLGKPVLGRAQLSFWYPPIENAWRQTPKRSGGGALMDLAGHCIDLLEMFFGPARSVSCYINNTIQNYASEDSAVTMLKFENGAMGMVDTFFCIPDEASKNVLELYGSLGAIYAKGTIGQGEAGEMTTTLKTEATGYNPQQDSTSQGETKISPPLVNTYRAEIEEFSRAILENRDPSCSAEIGLRSQKILAACYKSAKTGKSIAV
jgi:predicted dehydrogenase